MKVISTLIGDKKYVIFIFLMFGFIFSFYPSQDAFAAPTIHWDYNSISMNNGGVFGTGIASDPIFVTVTDSSLTTTDSIKVRITSSVDPIGFDLTLNEISPGKFKNTNLTLLADNVKLKMNSQVTVSIYDNRNGIPTPDIQMIKGQPFIVTSSHKTLDFFPKFTETGNNTNIYAAKINLGPTNNPSTNTLAAKPGDIFMVDDGIGQNRVMGFIEPNPNEGKGAIYAEVGGTVTATYQGISSSFTIDDYEGPGRGSGGLIRPGLVVDSSSGGDSSDGGGSNCSNCMPPTLGVDSKFNRVVENGFSFNGNEVNVEQYYTPYPLIKSNVGQENIIKLKIYDDGGTQSIAHVALAYGLGKGQSFSESKAIINLDKTVFGGEKTSLFDPENVLDKVKVVTSRDLCNSFSKIQCLIVEIRHIFRDTLEFNIVSTNVWDEKKNSWTNFYNHGIEVEGVSMNPAKTKSVAFGEKDKRGLFVLTEIDKRKHLWTDEFGDIYENRGNDFFVRVFKTPQEHKLDELTSHGCDRNCNWFEDYKFNQEIQAKNALKEMMKGKSIKNDSIKIPFSYEYHIISRADDIELQQNIVKEKQKASETFQMLFPERKSQFTN